MPEQLKFTNDGQIKGDHEHKVELAIQRLKAFEPPEGYYHTMSYGKDSQCTYHLLKMAGCKFDSHYVVTSCDPPELIRFGKEHYLDVKWERQYWNDGKPEHYYPNGKPKPITMWNLISSHTLPPTRKVRYCCASLKEPGGGDEWLSQVFDGPKAIIERKLTELLIYKVNQSQQSNLQTN